MVDGAKGMVQRLVDDNERLRARCERLERERDGCVSRTPEGDKELESETLTTPRSGAVTERSLLERVADALELATAEGGWSGAQHDVCRSILRELCVQIGRPEPDDDDCTAVATWERLRGEVSESLTKRSCIRCGEREPMAEIWPYCSAECLHADPDTATDPAMQRRLKTFAERDAGAGGPGGMTPTNTSDALGWYLAGAQDEAAQRDGIDWGAEVPKR